ncbi:hypothetical protein J4573_35060 [Actinomadura barringtoniae]|uniref:Uncharacterized protein n=1 Tax=Actinomadura barringtoniae TaxID=1427535 RepID=A0A939PGR7_9ACTN|nr:hypothetical protein [Actinomadura barringtoniae]MBO2452355.1 hypothetical protein [Actinomadura barringtoniae]
MPQLKSRTTVVIAAMAAAVTAVVLTVVLSSSGKASEGGRGEGRLASPAFTADTVPVSQGLKKGDCGLSKGTAQELVPGVKKSGDRSCDWFGDDRFLTVDDGLSGAPPVVTSSADTLYAISPRPPKRFSGLGDDEALARTSSPYGKAEAEISLTLRGSYTRVTYGGRGLTETKAEAGALKAATDIAKNLGAPAKPSPSGTTPVGGAAPGFAALPRVCDTVPGDALDRLVRGADRSRGEANQELTQMFAQLRGGATDTCEWNASGPAGAKVDRNRVLQVTVGSVPDWEPGAGARAITRAYLRLHGEARGDGTGKAGAAERFHALKGLGDQAFGGTWSQYQNYGRVVFRLRNVLVDVLYRGEDTQSKTLYRTDLPGDKALAGAYTAALGIAGVLKSPQGAAPMAGPVTQRLPRDCGLSAATLRSLVPKAEVVENGDFGECRWFVREQSLSLEVSLRAYVSGSVADLPGSVLAISSSGLRWGRVRTSPLGDAVTATGLARYSNDEPEPLTGVGEDGVGGFRAGTGAGWTQFRVGNVVARVSYGVDRFGGAKPRAEASLRASALKASAEIARSLGSAPHGTPAYGTGGGAGAPLAPPSSACGLVSGKVLGKVIKGHRSPTPNTDVAKDGVLVQGRRSTCAWGAKDRVLTVTVASGPGADRRAAEQAAARAYLASQLNAQAGQPISGDDEKYYKPLTGLGDQAFASYLEEGSPGRIMVRSRNLLLEVTFASNSRSKPPNRRQSIDAVSAVAAEAASKLPR